MQPQLNNVREQEIRVPSQGEQLTGTLALPPAARGLVLFAHGSGSSRFSPRNRYVAQVLQQAGLATLLLDLLTPAEEAIDVQTRQLRFDIPLLATRLGQVTDWLQHQEDLGPLPLGYFGASTGAAAALLAAADQPTAVKAIVSRGGRPDLAGQALGRVAAPTLLIVGGHDPVVLDLNQTALRALPCSKQLIVIPGATHLFEEPGCLEQVASLAAHWFGTYLTRSAPLVMNSQLELT